MIPPDPALPRRCGRQTRRGRCPVAAERCLTALLRSDPGRPVETLGEVRLGELPDTETTRALLAGTPASGSTTLLALGWCVLIGALGYAWARALYRRERR